MELLLLVGVVRYYPGAVWNGEEKYLYNYEWQESPVYHQDIDGETKYGYSLGLLRRSFVGGSWSAGDSSICGSRSVHCCYFPTPINDSITIRGCSFNIILGR